MTCTVCGCSPSTDIVPGVLRDLRVLLGPRRRATVGHLRDTLCHPCQRWVAAYFEIAL
jgi:hypothetical protein